MGKQEENDNDEKKLFYFPSNFRGSRPPPLSPEGHRLLQRLLSVVTAMGTVPRGRGLVLLTGSFSFIGLTQVLWATLAPCLL